VCAEALRHVHKPRECPQGPQGLQGLRGVTGAQGPQGAQGSPGAPGSNATVTQASVTAVLPAHSVLAPSSATVTVPGGGTAVATATCGAGYVPVSCLFSATSGNANATFCRAVQFNGSSCECLFTNTSGQAQGASCRAVCLKTSH